VRRTSPFYQNPPSDSKVKQVIWPTAHQLAPTRREAGRQCRSRDDARVERHPRRYSANL